jgi:hypothetical protein
LDVNSEHWEAYAERFQAVAETAKPWLGQKPALGDSALYLCLFGENGLNPDEEFALLDRLAVASPLYRLDVDTDYWQEIVLFVPEEGSLV